MAIADSDLRKVNAFAKNVLQCLSILGLPQKSLELGLRLPLLYLMDRLMLHDLGLAFTYGNYGQDHATFKSSSHNFVIRRAPDPERLERAMQADLTNRSSYEAIYWQLYGNPDLAVVPYLLSVGICTGVYLACLFVITLSVRELLIFYAYFLASVCIPASYMSHRFMIDKVFFESESAGPTQFWLINYLLVEICRQFTPLARALALDALLQCSYAAALGGVLKFHYDSYDKYLVRFLAATVNLPILAAACGFGRRYVEAAATVSLVVPGSLICMALWKVTGRATRFAMLTLKAKKRVVANFGLNAFLENEWTRLKIPMLLRTFWTVRFLAFVGGKLDERRNASGWMELGRSAISGGADTLIAVLGMTSVVSGLCHEAGALFYNFLESQEEDEKSVASVSAVLFFVLALQTGLTSLEPEKRFSRLCKNACLLVTALLHFLHNMVHPVLMGLSAGRNLDKKKHFRALTLCAFLLVAPVALMIQLWRLFELGTWLLAVSSFCIEVAVKVAVTVGVYLLFLYDQHCKDGLWDMLDDAVYHLKAFGSTLEFFFAVFLFFNGGFILFFESGGTIRAVMMLMHGYCNIWCEAKAGWQKFHKRLTAVSKINALPDATAEELERHEDVCAICYQNLVSSAKKTRCGHFFHALCLRKWLYLQDVCPLCHAMLNAKTQDGGRDRDRDRPPLVDLEDLTRRMDREADGIETESQAGSEPEVLCADLPDINLDLDHDRHPGVISNDDVDVGSDFSNQDATSSSLVLESEEDEDSQFIYELMTDGESEEPSENDEDEDNPEISTYILESDDGDAP